MTAKTLTAAALALMLPSLAQAATLTLTATALYPWQSSDFSIVFDDADGDSLLSHDEVVSFSGFTSNQLGFSYSELLRVSPIPAETDEVQTFTSGGFAINTWLFGEGTDRTTEQPTSFTYTISAVPLPASALLLMAAVGGLAATRRRKPA